MPLTPHKFAALFNVAADKLDTLFPGNISCMHGFVNVKAENNTLITMQA
jgi:hypothetical protein